MILCYGYQYLNQNGQAPHAQLLSRFLTQNMCDKHGHLQKDSKSCQLDVCCTDNILVDLIT